MPLASGVAWDAGPRRRRRPSSAPRRRRRNGRRRRFREGPGVLLRRLGQARRRTSRSGPIVARMDDQHDYRGWDLWIENGRVGTHIINKWPDRRHQGGRRTNPSRPSEWNHVSSPTTARARPAGVQASTSTATQQDNQRRGRPAEGHHPHDVPFKIAQRHSTSRLDGAGDPGRAHLRPRAVEPEVESAAPGDTRAAWLADAGRPASARRPRRTSCSTGG